MKTRVKPEEMESLKALVRWYGAFEVSKALSMVVSESSEKNYSNNPDAVIHRDADSLSAAVVGMRGNHALRLVD